MKVLQVLYSGLGGHGSVVTSLINADTEKQWDHALLFYGIEDLLLTYKEFCKQKNIPYSFVQKKSGMFRPGTAAVKEAFRKHAPDVIIMHSPTLIFIAWWYCLFRKKKIFVVEHTPISTKKIGEKIASFFSSLIARKIVCLTQDYQYQMKKKFWFLPIKKRTVVISNGIDLQKFKPIKFSKDRSELNAGMIGRFSIQKNQAMIISALERGVTSGTFSKEIIIHFAGTGETLEQLKKIVFEKRLDNQIRFYGLLDEKGIIDLLEKLDIYIHASFSETMCTSVMQAMACGLPVVASDIPGINNIVAKEENALLFQNNDINTLVDEIANLQDIDKRQKMGLSARQYALAHFSVQDTFGKYNRLINL